MPSSPARSAAASTTKSVWAWRPPTTAQYIESQRQQGRRAETSEVTLELTYLAQLTRWLTAQQSLQYVVNPNTDPSRRDAFVASFRFEASF